jgi:hypothetical protein
MTTREKTDPSTHQAVVTNRDSAEAIKKQVLIESRAANTNLTRPPNVDSRAYPERRHTTFTQRDGEDAFPEQATDRSWNVFYETPRKLKKCLCKIAKWSVTCQSRP